MRVQLGLMVVLGFATMGADGGCGGRDPAPTTCPELLCDIACPNGKKLDADGCETCACKPDVKPDPKPTVCALESDCATGLVCDKVNFCELPPGCREGVACPPVCYGRCVKPTPPPAGCYSDSECPTGQRCTASTDCLPPPGCGPGQTCPAVCYGKCVGTTPENDQKLCEMTAGKWNPYACGNAWCGQQNACDAIIPGCDCGAGRNFFDGKGCYEDTTCRANECEGAFYNPRTGGCTGPEDGSRPDYCCEKPPPPPVCGDQSGVMCDAMPPQCPTPLVAVPHNGCWACADPADCAVQCTSDADCGRGAACVERVWSPCGDCDPASGQPCCMAPDYLYSVCEPRNDVIVECTSDAECAAGTTCQPDPTDPCNQPGVECFRAGRMTCQQVSCPPLACRLACPYGMKVDANGCNLCECNPPPPVCEIECAMYQPVCGADGVTYGCGAADAACHNTTVAYTGECGSVTCAIACLVYEPVCGADGVTYGCGAADAACHHTTVAYTGECGATTTNCRTDAECTLGQKCHIPQTSSSRMGQCKPVDYCDVSTDCTGLPAPASACRGAWMCETNSCAWRCAR